MEEYGITTSNFNDLKMCINVDIFLEDLLHGKLLKINIYPENEDHQYIRIRNIPTSEGLKAFGVYDYSFSISPNAQELHEDKREYEFLLDNDEVLKFTMFNKEVAIGFFENLVITENIFMTPTEGVSIEHRIDLMHCGINIVNINTEG